MSTFHGTKHDDDLTGTTGDDTFALYKGGSDTASGADGNDVFNMGASLDASDRLDGGADRDAVTICGDYSGGLTFDGLTLRNIEVLRLGDGFDYKLTLADGNVAAGTYVSIDASALGGAHSLTFDGSAETDGQYLLYGGAGNDTLTGGGLADKFRLDTGGSDTAHGGGGDDVFVMADMLTAADSIDGGAGSDTLSLNGDYSGGYTFGASQLAGIESIVVAGVHTYAFTEDDGNVASGATMTVDASALTGSNQLSFFGGAETDGHFAFIGGAGADDLEGGAQSDTFDLSGGGSDTATGGGGNDTFTMGGAFGASDVIDGGAGTADLIALNADYSAGLTLGATTIANVEGLTYAGGHSYKIIFNDGNLSAGQKLTTFASSTLGASDSIYLDGSAETSGAFSMDGGAGNDTFIGGGGDDSLRARGGVDALYGGGGNDVFRMDANLTAADAIDGGAGTHDILTLDGNYSAGVVFAATTMVNVEEIQFATTSQSYNLTTHDATVAAGATLAITTALGAAAVLTFNGAAELDGSFNIIGGAGSDSITGGAQADTFNLNLGGNDTVHGGGGGDTFNFAGATSFTAADALDGGTGTDTLNLNAVSSPVVFNASTVTNIERIVITTNGLNLTTADATVASGATLTVDASALSAANALTLNGAAESDGSFAAIGGAGADRFTGGALADSFDLTAGGADIVRYTAIGQSASVTHDTITGFTAGTDKLDLATTVTGIFAASGAVDTASFDSDLAALNPIQAQGATIVTVTGGDLNGHTLLVVDGNGDDVYTAGQDYVIDITGYTGTIGVSDFV